MTTTRITYEFGLSGGRSWVFDLDFEAHSRRLIAPADDEPRAWSALEFHQCTNCPLRASECERCPVAVNLAPVLAAFSDARSHEEATVAIRTKERQYQARRPLHDGLSSLIGLIMATSGCPVLDLLRPMVHLHLPFASSTETTFRAVSTYLLAQYFRQKQGLEPDWRLERLVGVYEEVRTVNRCFAQRMAHAARQDASANALVHLDLLADMAQSSIREDWWEELEPAFAAHERSGQTVG